MPPRRHPANQEPLPDMPAFLPEQIEDEPQLDLTRRMAFGKVPNLLVRSTSGNPELEVTDEDFARVNPGEVETHLFRPNADWRTGTGRYVDGVLFNEQEFLAIPGNVPALAGRTAIKIEKARSPLSTGARGEAADDGTVKMLEGYQTKQRRLIESTDKEIVNLVRIKELLRSPGFANSTGLELLTLTAQAWETTFKNMVAVTAKEAGWTDEQHAKSSEALFRAMSEGLTMSGNLGNMQNMRIAAWGMYTRLGLTYASAKRQVFNGRVQGIQDQIGRINRNNRDRFAS